MPGGVAAKTVGDEGSSGRLLLKGNERGVPLGGPPLSKTYLRGEEDLSGWYVQPAEWFAKNDVELVRATAMGLHAKQRRLDLNTGEVIEFGKLLIATGGRNKRILVPGAELPGMHQLRTAADCDAIKADARKGDQAVVVGMGFIGSEVAASLRQMGVRGSAGASRQSPPRPGVGARDGG